MKKKREENVWVTVKSEQRKGELGRLGESLWLRKFNKFSETGTRWESTDEGNELDKTWGGFCV
jgi:hypothetical protein